jgi:hypothetical protein
LSTFFQLTASPWLIEMLLGENPLLLIWTPIVAAPAIVADASAAAPIASMAAMNLIFEPPVAPVFTTT